jgi:signal transduction histidine kinase
MVAFTSIHAKISTHGTPNTQAIRYLMRVSDAAAERRAATLRPWADDAAIVPSRMPTGRREAGAWRDASFTTRHAVLTSGGKEGQESEAPGARGPPMDTDHGFDTARLGTLVRLARSTAHEMRGAAGTIAIHGELLSTTLDAVEDAALRERLSRYLAVLERERQRLLDIFHAFLALVASQGPPVAVDVSALLEETGAALRPLAIECGVRLEVARPPRPVFLTAVGESVRQQVLDLMLPMLHSAAVGSNISVELVAGAETVAVTVHGPQGVPAVLDLSTSRRE